MNYDRLAELYDLQYADYRDDIPFYVRLADDYGSPILEIGAGTGRVTEALARAGHDVTALDSSQAMLARARARFAGGNLARRIRLIASDMRTFELNERFPLVMAPFNTYMHAYTLSEQDALLAAVKRQLEPGGAFALDLYNPNFAHVGTLRSEREWSHVGGSHDELFLQQTVDADAQLVSSKYYWDKVREDGALTRRTAYLVQRYSTRFELERALRQAGFGHVDFFGGFDRRRYSANEGHLIAVAR